MYSVVAKNAKVPTTDPRNVGYMVCESLEVLITHADSEWLPDL